MKQLMHIALLNILIFFLSLSCGCKIPTCSTTLSISEANDVANPFWLKRGVCYNVNIPRECNLFFAYEAEDNYSIYLSNYQEGGGYIILDHYRADSNFQKISGGLKSGYILSYILAAEYECSKVEFEQQHYFKVQKHSIPQIFTLMVD